MFEKFIMNSKPYKALKNRYELLNHNYNELLQLNKQQQAIISKRDMWLEKSSDEITKHKEIAEKIITSSRKLIRKDEIIQKQKEIQELCNEIIKGEN